MRLTEADFQAILAAAERSVFAQFWQDLLQVLHATDASIGDVLRGKGPLGEPAALRESVTRLRAQEWPFLLSTDGGKGLLRAFRVLARRAGLPDANVLEFHAVSRE